MSLADAENIAEEADVDMTEANLEALLVMHAEVQRQRVIIEAVCGRTAL